jgi:hypothetical protein
MLGHADAKTTSIYLNVTSQHLQDSMKRFGTQQTETRPTLPTVANETQIDPQPSCNDDLAVESEVVVN